MNGLASSRIQEFIVADWIPSITVVFFPDMACDIQYTGVNDNALGKRQKERQIKLFSVTSHSL